MNSSEEQKGPGGPGAGASPSGGESAFDALKPNVQPLEAAPADGSAAAAEYADGYPHEPAIPSPQAAPAPPIVPDVISRPSAPLPVKSPRRPGGGGKTPPPPPSGGGGEPPDEDDRMLRMSFLEHL